MDRRTFLSRRHEQLSWQYFRTCAGPMIGALAAIPTLACAERAEPPPLWPQLPLSPLYLLQHFAYGRGSHEYTIFTSLLLHRDAHHRDNNAVSLALAGFGPFLVWGWPGFWALILGGNAAACLTFQDGRKVQLQSSIERHTGGLLKQGGNITSGLSRALALLPAQACGASAGVFALMGADLCLLADRVAALLVHLQVPAHDRAMPTAQLAFELVPALVSAQRILQAVQRERFALAAGQSLSTGHSAHLVGFGFGVALYAIWRVGTSGGGWRPRLVRVRSRFGDAGGQRLGRR